MAPHIVRAPSTYKDIRMIISSLSPSSSLTPPPQHTHTHTHNKYMHYWWWISKTTDQYTEEMRWDFSSDLKDESEDECLGSARRMCTV